MPYHELCLIIFNAESINLSSLKAKMLCQSSRGKKVGMSALLVLFPYPGWKSLVVAPVASSVLTDETQDKGTDVNEIISFNPGPRSASLLPWRQDSPFVEGCE